ncbi:hypothetical protein ILUMI_16178 [Ignelater luminosus]|uniref:Uncharacterized protein n=1 Tax=Ignelater luminosus TaxID=2038154 RepID=A0A8K0G353_IGNLU|nr:hypothetical protein ILUMI_16178 [Ignelater luminosus]
MENDNEKLGKIVNMMKDLMTEIRQIKEQHIKEIKEIRQINENPMEENCIKTENRNVLKDEIRHVMKEYPQVEVKVEQVYKIGKQGCVMELQSEAAKVKIMKEKIKLRNVPNVKIYIHRQRFYKERKENSRIHKKKSNGRK